mmetsp:Transcript_18586/g.41223  ORF Transcript_18586/g.41223 Transcript_18586/m.41223 type:complete len:209 (-) Transcript_18586:378-1004(-)
MSYKAAVGGRLQAVREQGQQTVMVVAAEVMGRASCARNEVDVLLATRVPMVHAYLKEFGSRGSGKVVTAVACIRSMEMPLFPQLHDASIRVVQSVTGHVQSSKAQALAAKASVVTQTTCAVQQAKKSAQKYATIEQAKILVASLTQTATQKTEGVKARAQVAKTIVITTGTEAAQLTEKTLREQLVARVGEKKAAQVMDWLLIPAALC